MDKSAIAIGVILTVLFMAPIAYVVYNNLSTERRIKKLMLTLYGGNKTAFTNFERIGDTIIAIDETAKKLIFSSASKTKEDYKMVDLNAVQHCEIKAERHTNKTIDCVALELIGEGFAQGILFYKEDEDESPSTDAQICLEQARQWQKRITKAKAA